MTVFLSRLLKRDFDKICYFADLYASKKKVVPASYKGVYNKTSLLFLYWKLSWCGTIGGSSHIFFNFSKVRSLWFFAFLRSSKTTWALMLHHGSLVSRIPNIVLRIILNRFEVVYAINNQQRQFYSSLGIKNVRLATSYVAPILEIKDAPVFIALNLPKKSYFLGSGYSSALYNHGWNMEYFSSRRDYDFVLCLYGPIKGRERLISEASRYTNIHVLQDLDEVDFNSILFNSRCYLRPNSMDSLGVAAADAMRLGCDCVASDVCPRADGVLLFSSGNKISYFKTLDNYIKPERGFQRNKVRACGKRIRMVTRSRYVSNSYGWLVKELICSVQIAGSGECWEFTLWNATASFSLVLIG